MNECKKTPLEILVKKQHNELNRYKERVADLKEERDLYIAMLESEFDKKRTKLWMDVCTAVASASNAKDKECMTTWADYALKAFNERFKPNTDEKCN